MASQLTEGGTRWCSSVSTATRRRTRRWRRQRGNCGLRELQRLLLAREPEYTIPRLLPIIGAIDTAQGLRTQLGNQMIAKRVAGTDGLGPPKFNGSSLQAMWESDQSGLAQSVLKPLVSACEATPAVKANNGTEADLTACTALARVQGHGAPERNWRMARFGVVCRGTLE